MQQSKIAEGKLNVTVSSEGRVIPAGKSVVVYKVIDNFKNIFIEVQSLQNTVRLNYFDTNVKFLMGAK